MVQYTYTIGADLISQERNGRTYTYLYDGHGSVVGLMNEGGSVTDTYTYDAFGNLLKSTGRTENNYRYCGEQFDSTTGLYYLRARYMDTSIGRFITQDSYAGSVYDPVSLHKYLYANSNPITYSDPSGYFVSYSKAKYNYTVAQIGFSIIRTLKAVVDTYTVKNLIAVALIPASIYLGGKLQTAVLNSQINNTLKKVLVGASESVINDILIVNAVISSLIVTVAKDLSDYWNDHNGNHTHHIVPRNLWYAAPAREILRRVNIDVESSYNKIEICAKTHRAIHSGSLQLLYCSWVDILLISSYSNTRTILQNEENVKNTLGIIYLEIREADVIIRML